MYSRRRLADFHWFIMQGSWADNTALVGKFRTGQQQNVMVVHKAHAWACMEFQLETVQQFEASV